MSDTTKKHKAEAPERLRFGIFICSTSRYQQYQKEGKVEDVSGDLIEALLKKGGHRVVFRKIISDNRETIMECTQQVLAASNTDVLVFCGGTGLAPSDVTIEVLSSLFEKKIPGFGEVFRFLSYQKIGSAAILSRATAGIAKGKATFCIPGSPDAINLCVEKLILPEAAHIVKHAREK